MYKELLSELPNQVCETETAYLYFTERHLQAIWLEQKYFRDLVDANGNPVQIVSPGLWNGNAGPDFMKAHLRINGQDILGDIELHLADEGWNQHKHQHDSRYDNVVFHLSLWRPKNEKPLLRKDGQEIKRAYLQDRLTIPLARLVQMIDLDLYPYRKFVGSGRCAQELFTSLKEEQIDELFSSAARWRLEQKRQYLSNHIADPALRLPAGIAMALGYKANTEAFLTLFQWLYTYRQSAPDTLLAMGLGACGFFEELFSSRWRESVRFTTLRAIWDGLNPQPTQRWTIDTTQQRPLNHPARRIGLMTLLIQDPQTPTLFSTLLNCWRECWPHAHTPRDWRRVRERLIDCFPKYEDAYWTSHYTFEAEARAQSVPVFGEEFIQSVLVNTFLPLLHELACSDNKELSALLNLFRALMAPDSGKRRYVTHRFFGETPKGALLKRSITEQGALQIHHDFCVHYEASCEGCPFIARVKNSLELPKKVQTGYCTAC